MTPGNKAAAAFYLAGEIMGMKEEAAAIKWAALFHELLRRYGTVEDLNSDLSLGIAVRQMHDAEREWPGGAKHTREMLSEDGMLDPVR